MYRQHGINHLGSNIIQSPSTRQLLSCDRKFIPNTLISPNAGATTMRRSVTFNGPISRTAIFERRTSIAPFAVCRIVGYPDWSTSRPASVAAFSDRSEEHTSELQSLMRISYAVFSLKTK